MVFRFCQISVVIVPTLSDLSRNPAGPLLLLAAAPTIAMSKLILIILIPSIIKIIQKNSKLFAIILLLSEERVVRTVVPELLLPLQEGGDGILAAAADAAAARLQVVPQEAQRGPAPVSRQFEDGDGAARVDVVVEVVAKVSRAHANLKWGGEHLWIHV